MIFGGGSAPVLMFQCSLYWAGIILIADGLRQRGQGWGAAAIVFCAAMPIPLGQMGSILKDPLLAACCLAAAGLGLSDRHNGMAEKVAGGMAILLLVFATATRFNAVFATAPLLAALAPQKWTTRMGGALLTLCGSGLLLATVGYAIDAIALHPRKSQPIFSQVNFDLAGIVAHGGSDAYPDMDPAGARRITAHCYTPGEYNPAYLPECDAIEERLRDFSATHHLGALSIWVRAIDDAPLAYVRHRIAHLNRNWRFFVANVPDDAIYVMTTPNPFGLAFTENGATRAVAVAANGMAWSPIGRPATWVAIAVGILLVGGRLRSRRLVMGLAASALIYGGAYGLASVSQDLRYNLWTMVAGAMALVVTIAGLIAEPEKRPSRRRVVLAALPTILIVLAELAGLLSGTS
jgi:hypothetical protein